MRTWFFGASRTFRTESAHLVHSSSRCRTRWHTTPNSLRRAWVWPPPCSTTSRTSSSTLGWTISSPSRTSCTSRPNRRMTTRRRRTIITMRRTPMRESRTPMRRNELHQSLGESHRQVSHSTHSFYSVATQKTTTKIIVVVINNQLTKTPKIFTCFE